MRRCAPALVAAALLLSGCANFTQLTADDRTALTQRLVHRESDKYLRLSFYATPLFGDGTKRLLTAVAPDEVRLLEQPDGTPVHPGQILGLFPAGTRAHITKVEFPTAWAVAERVLYTPRTRTWVYLQIEGEPATIPYVLVLGAHMRNEREFLAELDRYLLNENPEHRISTWPEWVRSAVKKKRARLDMPEEALEMAWGYPEVKRKNAPAGIEEWIWPSNKRKAKLKDGRVADLLDPEEEF